VKTTFWEVHGSRFAVSAIGTGIVSHAGSTTLAEVAPGLGPGPEIADGAAQVPSADAVHQPGQVLQLTVTLGGRRRLPGRHVDCRGCQPAGLGRSDPRISGVIADLAGDAGC
jgi:hypothetical protein